jgi:hypothetical protein
MFAENGFVGLLGFVVLVGGLVEPRQVVGGCHGDGAVVRLVVLRLVTRTL